MVNWQAALSATGAREPEDPGGFHHRPFAAHQSLPLLTSRASACHLQGSLERPSVVASHGLRLRTGGPGWEV